MTGAAAAPQAGKLDELMLAMDVVDTLRHRDDLVARELDEAGREDQLIGRLREIYRQQGIEVPDAILADGVKALKDSRFVYTPPGPSLQRRLATLYVRRGTWGRRVAALAAALGIGWGAWQLGVVAPERRSAEAARVELAETLPKRLAEAQAEVLAIAVDPAARERADALKADGDRAVRAGDRAAAAKATADLDALRAALTQEYVLTIVSRANADTGVWRVPPRNPGGRNFYLIVEAVAPDGRKLSLPIRNEETGAVETVSMFGVRVPQAAFEAVARDKRDDGIVQRNRFGQKRRGMLEPDYAMPFEGGHITKW